jgi:hypothetical protein
MDTPVHSVAVMVVLEQLKREQPEKKQKKY